MKKETQVLCDVCKKTMEWQRYEIKGSLDTRGFWRCPEPGCSRHFASAKGYVDMLDGKIDETNREYHGCKKSSEHGSMTIVGFNDRGPIWQCTERGCAPEARSRFVGSPMFMG